MHHRIRPAPAALWHSTVLDAAAWRELSFCLIDWFHPKSSDHRPQTRVALAYTDDALLVRCEVRDRYVKCISTHYQDMVCKDSCVELFVQPKPDRGYFNFEINCGGTMLLYYIEDARRVNGSFAKHTKVSPEHAAMIEIVASMPKVTAVEIADPVDWSIALRIPFAMLEAYVGSIGSVRGQMWRGNLYKCADQTSHPHWASWSPIGEALNFHQPEKFGEFVFE